MQHAIKKVLTLIFASYAVLPMRGQPHATDSPTGLRADVLLHPGEAFTAYTYKKGTFFYGQPLAPYPGFAQIGLTDWLTVELPFWEWLGQVVSLNLRFKLRAQNAVIPAMAYETQYQYLPREVDLLADLNNIGAIRKGHNWFHRINATWALGRRLMVHLSVGVTYSGYLRFTNKDALNPVEYRYANDLSPDISLGIDWRTLPWLSLHSSLSRGSTYMYIDNTARKQQVTLSTRLAPFYKSRVGFLNSFRVEMTLFSMKFGRLPERIISPAGFIYWQWRWKKKKHH